MNGIIYKAVPSITKDEILQICRFDNEISVYGDVMSYDEFASCVKCYGITDYDGSGELILSDKVVTNSEILCYNRSVYFDGKLFVPFDVLHSIFGDDMKFIWYNK